MDLSNYSNGNQCVVELFETKKMVKICAPMVRYSKLSFRMLVRKYDCDIAFTPMIVSHSFIESIKARDSDFSTCNGDRPLIIQFAAKNGKELADASELTFKYTDGVDLNCGCPQRWALADGYGACLLDKPELLEDMIHQVRNRIPNPKYSVSMKIRIHDDIRRTVELCKRAEKAGTSWISVHGRTRIQRNEPVDLEKIKLIKENVSIPVVGNGDIFSLKDAENLQKVTGVNGVMSARGLLQNPSLFSGTENTTLACIKDWIDISISYGTTFTNMHHHLMFMLDTIMSKHERKLFNSYTSITAVLDHLNNSVL